MIAMAERLGGGALKGFKVGLLHGRMRSAEKDRVMREFRDGALDALVSTTVVEVGIDVPEATVMVVIAAERYGLAQLHQLRGRVGRGEWASRCCLVASRGADAQALERLSDHDREQERRGGCRGGSQDARPWRLTGCSPGRRAAAALRPSDSRPSHDRTRTHVS